MAEFNVAVVGATGVVGAEMLKILEERGFPVGRVVPLASEASLGKKVCFNDEWMPIEVLDGFDFEGIDIALFSAGKDVSLKYAPKAVKAGAVVIDNTSAFRMNDEIPLVVPEVNPERIEDFKNKGIIANPNCSTIQLVLVLKPIHDKVKIKRVVVSTYQAVSGAGLKAMEELSQQTVAMFSQKELKVEHFNHQIAFNCLPQIDSFEENGYTKEEMKMTNETIKILGDPSIKLTATTVRVPVFNGHSEAVNIETYSKISADEVRALLSKAPGVKVIDDIKNNQYPMPINAAGNDPAYVGRIREDISTDNGICFWVVADNLRKGAALNAVQIAEILAKEYL
ncbi:aspartate-semialdehyde dehydrogenase [bacterium]|nr:aspartate-semialdehyde dehydrogenase [bacterium]